MSRWGDVFRLDADQLDVATGLRAAAFALTPLLLGLLSSNVGAGAIASLGALNEDVVSTLGAINLSVMEPGRVPSLPRTVALLLLGCLVNALGFSMGTLVGLAGLTAVPLVAAGVFAAMSMRLRSDLSFIGVTAATVFVVGVGLPGASEPAAFSRFWLVLAGGVWALLGALLQWMAVRRRARPPSAQAPEKGPSSHEIAVHSLVVAVTAAVALGVSDYAGLVRDYWVMLTVVVTVRLKPSLTLSFTVMRVIGTVAGAVVALATTAVVGTGWYSLLPLLLFAVGMFSTRNVNFVLFSLFLTSFIILLLDLAYPGTQELALLRVVDTCLGGALALVAGGLWSVSSGRRPAPGR